jgi:glycerol-3-phosphate dehydrogenase (NAD(P)+)
VSSRPEVALASADIVLIAVPAQAMRQAIRPIAPLLDGKIVVSCAKGLEIATFRRPTQMIDEELRNMGMTATICALSGPNLATEIAAGKPASTVIASTDAEGARAVQSALASSRFRIYTNVDVIGVEMAGALKNILAIGAGIADGMDAGDNAKAAFLTRGIAEIARLGIACGAEPLTFAGLAGIGDVMATCASPLSRNHRVGVELAKGRTLAEILAEMNEVAEGVPTTRAAVQLGRALDVSIPITDQMYAVLFAGKSPRAAIAELMARDPTDEMAAFR